ncbi:MAG: hypothetical protein V1663_03895 [archaeon]
MKRVLKDLFIFLSILQITLPIVSAQSTIKVLNKEFQLVIFIPLVLIFLAIFILIILYIIDYTKRIKELKEKIKIKNIFSLLLDSLRLKKKDEKKDDTVDIRRQLTLSENKISKLNPEEALKEITFLQREFYKHVLNLKPTTSDTELKTILTKKEQSDIIAFAEKISEIKYSGSDINKEKIKELISNLSLVIKKHSFHLHFSHDEEEKTRRKVKSLKKHLFENARNNLKDIKNKFIDVKNYFHKLTIKNRKERILNMIKDGKQLLNTNNPTARNMYIKALLSYYKLRLQEEKEIHSRLQEFHDELNQRGHVKQDLSELSKKIITLKHSDKKKEGLNFFNQLKDYIKNEEKSNIKKLEKYSRALETGESKLTQNIKELEYYAVIKDKRPLLNQLKKLEPKKEVFKIPQEKIIAPPKLEIKKTKVKLSKHLSNLVNEKNLLYNKLKSLENETVNYQKETNIHQKQFFSKYVPEQAEHEPKELPRLVRKYDAHKHIHKLSQERELIERKLTELK